MEKPKRIPLATSSELRSRRAGLVSQSLLRSSGLPEEIEKEEGVIDGALFCVYWPPPPRKGVVIHCHGCRPEGIELSADLNPRERVYAWMLEEGWVVGMTSYGVEGLAITRGQTDVLRLRDHVFAQMEDKDEKVAILEAESMGGAIATFLAELPLPNPFAAVLATGAALIVSEKDKNGQILRFSSTPHIPILFLTNEEETHVVEEYIMSVHEKKSDTQDASIAMPLLWIVRRMGHCNVNSSEKVAGFQELTERKSSVTPHEATTPIVPIVIPEGVWGTVLSTDAWGDLYTNILPSNIRTLGIAPGESFYVDFPDNSLVPAFRVRYGANSFLSVQQGQWMAFDHGEGFVVFSANGYSVKHRASDMAHAKRGSAIHVLRRVGVGAALLGIPGPLELRARELQRMQKKTEP